MQGTKLIMGLENPPKDEAGLRTAKLPLREIETPTFNPGAGRLPPPEAMAAYSAIDSEYPSFLWQPLTPN